MRSLWREWQCIRSSDLVRNAAWMFAGQGLSIICQGVYFILLARLLGVVQYGIYVGAVAMVSILSQYSSLGSSYVLLRYVSIDPKKFSIYWGNVLIITFVLGIFLTAFLTWGGPHWAHSYSWAIVLCIATGECLCAQLTATSGRVFQAFENLRMTAVLNLLVNLLRVVLAEFLLWNLHHATAQQWVVATLIVSFFAVCVAVALVTRFYGKPVFSVALLRKHIGEGLVFALSGTTSDIYDDIDKVLLGHYGMNAANGIYIMAYKVVNVCMMPVYSIHGAASPRFFRMGAGGVHSTTAYALRILKRTVPIGLLLTGLMFLVAPIIPHLVGNGFGESVTALRWLCLLPLFRAFQWSAGDALTGAGHQKLRLSTQAGAAAFNFAVNLYLIPHYGWLGAAWASLATDGMLAAANWVVLLAVRGRPKTIEAA